MEEVGSFEAKTRLSELIERAHKGESFLITRRGLPMARIVPDNIHDRERARQALEELKSLRGSVKDTTLEEFMSARDEGRR